MTTGKNALRAALPAYFAVGIIAFVLFAGNGLDARTVVRIPVQLEQGARHVEIDDATLDALLDGIEVEPRAKAGRKPRVH